MANADRTRDSDSVSEKMRLLMAAWEANNYDLAMSLAESIKDTLIFERQVREAGPVEIGAEAFGGVSDLPAPWAPWARGWAYYKLISVYETVGLARRSEPIDVSIAFRADQTTDLNRELRVARIDGQAGTLHEIVSQIYDEKRIGNERRCRLIFQAEVPTHGRVDYLVFYGNANAELPDYVTDLRVDGQGYGLDITNEHYRARLSRQTGQLERVTYRREHGLELYAGGKGHGEPPDIDWAHDYVDETGFQKLRMRNWAACPNHDVVRGPLCVRVRRWGFPHSPVHPLFTPSRMHADQTYVFYAGLGYFMKIGRMEAVRDLKIQAMRDDEWVFSGYSFTQRVWFDSRGKLHEGHVPEEHADNLWGVGFYNQTSRDAFIALWLEHEAKGFAGLQHGGVPTLHYAGHGQLWSRYPAGAATFKAGQSVYQKNAYLVLPYPEKDPSAQIESIRHRLSHPVQVRLGDRPAGKAGASTTRLARHGETAETAPLKPAIWKALGEVRDEQLYKAEASIVDLGYVYDVRVRDGRVHVLVTMPHRGRPVYDFLVSRGGGRVEDGIRERVRRIKGVNDVVVDARWNPPWSVARLTETGRRAMGLAP